MRERVEGYMFREPLSRNGQVSGVLHYKNSQFADTDTAGVAGLRGRGGQPNSETVKQQGLWIRSALDVY